MSRIANDLHHIGTTKNGAEVYVNLIKSEAAVHIAHNPQILALTKEMLAKSTVTGKTANIEHDFGRTVGNSEIVETTPKDTIVYAKRLRYDSYNRFVRKRQLSPSSFVSLSLVKTENGEYELVNAWIGRQTPAFTETEASKLYWANHAIVLEGQQLQLRTVTKDAPY